MGWGIIADVDIESEPLRFMGDLRFHIWGLYKIAQLNKYRGRLSYLKDSLEIKFVDEDDDSDGVIGKSSEKEDAKIPESLAEEVGPGNQTNQFKKIFEK